ncbi:NarK family nitrate/nitrite MFS transporter [Vibrio maerlii]|uniref:NarK family nitrate/nitrite MFS transporter n=1 Tax=Vibrio maerlii TaxID=2231648 RepID=UPI000E3E1867|nr:NarK family nitrate/nitrite MFS transporter [Vibrio maerlii]
MDSFKLLSFNGKMKTLHLSWMAFFITFLVWFNLAPLLPMIKASLQLSDQQVKALLVLNVALTIPARVIIGALTDKLGPRRVYSSLLLLCSIPCFVFALATSFEIAAIARFLLGFIGAGFVIGIRLISEWFSYRQLGTAAGIYGGWGNFGSAAAAFTLPTIALWFGGEEGWRWAIGFTGLLSVIFAWIFFCSISDTPKGESYYTPKKASAIEITSKRDFVLLVVCKLPMYVALGLLTWQLGESRINLFSASISLIVYLLLTGLYLWQIYECYKVNKAVFDKPVEQESRYEFKQVAILNVLYFATFGSELAVVSILPLFFIETFELSPVFAGMVASSYAFMNLMSRPAGGWLSDHIGRKPILIVLSFGLALGYLAMAYIESSWPLPLAIIVTMLCSFFVQAGEGAVFATVPLIQRRLTGQISGMIGAYGNVGAVIYLTALTLLDYQQFFMFVAATSVVSFAISFMFKEPTGHIIEINADGSKRKIDVAS